MTMKYLDVEQGSPEWLAARKEHFCASDAAAMLSLSKIQTRAELLSMMASGTEKEFSDWEQKNLLEKGKKAESHWRPIADKIIGKAFYPSVGVDIVEGLPLLASFDGITMSGKKTWEHKVRSKYLTQYIAENRDLPDTHWPQVEHQLLVSGADEALFTTGDNGEEFFASPGELDPGLNDRALFYRSRPERRQRVIDGWQEFRKDLLAFVEPEKREALTAAVDTLPTPFVRADGTVTLSHNLEKVQIALTAYIKRYDAKPTTDQGFVDLDAAAKELRKAEQGFKAAKDQGLAQVSDVQKFAALCESAAEAARQAAIKYEKWVSEEKDRRKAEIISKAQSDLEEHIAVLNQLFDRWESRGVRPVSIDPPSNLLFVMAAKGLRTLESIEEKVTAALLFEKSKFNTIADHVLENMVVVDSLGLSIFDLFPNGQHSAQVRKEAEVFKVLAETRAAELKADEEARLEQAREQVRAEEAAKSAPAQTVDTEPAEVEPAAPEPSPVSSPRDEGFNFLPADGAQPDALISLSDLQKRLACNGAPLDISEPFLSELGFPFARKFGRVFKYRESDYLTILRALILHLRAIGAAA